METQSQTHSVLIEYVVRKSIETIYVGIEICIMLKGNREEKKTLYAYTLQIYVSLYRISNRQLFFFKYVSK